MPFYGLFGLAVHGGKIVVGVAFACGALNVAMIGNFAMCACPYAHIVAKLPIVEIMATGLPCSSKGAGFIMLETMMYQGLVNDVFNILCGFV